MPALRYFRSWTPFLVLFSILDISADDFRFNQTIPAENGAVCPGGTVQYTCITVSELSWQIDGSNAVTFMESMEVNSTEAINDFLLVLMAKNATDTGIKIISTATNDMVTSNHDGQPVVCYFGALPVTLYIKVADGPADCSKMFVMPECRATTNAMGDTDFSITLPNSTSLMCVEGYQIQFNGENKNVSLSSPSANFTISDGEGQSVQNEIVVYTLDYENRTGQVPCTYSISAPSAVQQFLEPECIMTTSQTVDITICWMQATVAGSCLTGNLPLLYIVEFNDNRFSNGTTTSTSYTLTNVTQETVVVITISPSLPFLGLTGPPSSKTLNLASMSCLPGSSMILMCNSATPPMTSSIASTPTPIPSPGHDNETVVIALGVTFAFLLFAGLLAAVCFAVICWLCFQRRKKSEGRSTDGNASVIHLCETPLREAVEQSSVADNQALELRERIETVPVSVLEFESEPKPVNPVPETVPEAGNLHVAPEVNQVPASVTRAPDQEEPIPQPVEQEAVVQGPEPRNQVLSPEVHESEAPDVNQVPASETQTPEDKEHIPQPVEHIQEGVRQGHEPINQVTSCDINESEDVDHPANTESPAQNQGNQKLIVQPVNQQEEAGVEASPTARRDIEQPSLEQVTAEDHKQIDQLIDRSCKVQKKHSKLMRQLERLTPRIESLGSCTCDKAKKLKEDLSRTKHKHQQLEGVFKDIASDLDTISPSNRSQTQDTIRQCSRRLHCAESTQDTLNDEVEELCLQTDQAQTQEILRCTKLLGERESEFNKKMQEIDKLNELLKNMTEEYEKQKERLKAEIAKLEKKAEDDRQEIDQLKKTIKDMNNRLEEAKKEATDAKKEATDAKKEATDAKKEATDAKKEATDAKKESTVAKEEAEEARQEAEKARNEAAEAKECAADFKGRADGLEENIDVLMEKIAKLEQLNAPVMTSQTEGVEGDSGYPTEPPTDLGPPGGAEPDCIPSSGHLGPPGGAEPDCINSSRRTNLGGSRDRLNGGHVPPRVRSSSNLQQLTDTVLAPRVEPPGMVSEAETETDPHESQKKGEMVGFIEMNGSSKNAKGKSGKADESDQSQLDFIHQPQSSVDTAPQTGELVVQQQLPSQLQLPKDDKAPEMGELAGQQQLPRDGQLQLSKHDKAPEMGELAGQQQLPRDGQQQLPRDGQQQLPKDNKGD